MCQFSTTFSSNKSCRISPNLEYYFVWNTPQLVSDKIFCWKLAHLESRSKSPHLRSRRVVGVVLLHTEGVAKGLLGDSVCVKKAKDDKFDLNFVQMLYKRNWIIYYIKGFLDPDADGIQIGSRMSRHTGRALKIAFKITSKKSRFAQLTVELKHNLLV